MLTPTVRTEAHGHKVDPADFSPVGLYGEGEIGVRKYFEYSNHCP